jgi:general secretion pathway protein J
MNRSRHTRGFTLIELLVALLIFAIFAAIAYGGLDQVLTAKARTTRESERLADLQTAFTWIARDIEQAVDRPIRDAYGDPAEAMIGGGTSLELTRAGWRNPAGLTRSNLQRVAYTLDDGRLRRGYWRVLDRAPDSEAHESVLLNDVQEMELRFLDEQGQWQPAWPVTNAAGDVVPMPRAVELSLEIDGWGRITRLFQIPDGADFITTQAQTGATTPN